MNKIIKGISIAAATLAVSAGIALAAGGYTLFGDARLVHPGNASNTAAELTTTGSNAYGGVDFTNTGVTTLNTLQNLSTDYKFVTGTCGLGSPRFQVNVTTPTMGTKNLFVYIGPPPNYTGCPMNIWTNTGNLVTPASLVDASQLGGAFYEPYSAVLAAYGSYPVTGIQVVADGSNQTVQVDNVMINNVTTTFEPNTPTSKDQCKKDGYKDLEDANGQPFKNQGQCVSYFNHQ